MPHPEVIRADIRPVHDPPSSVDSNAYRFIVAPAHVRDGVASGPFGDARRGIGAWTKARAFQLPVDGFNEGIELHYHAL